MALEKAVLGMVISTLARDDHDVGVPSWPLLSPLLIRAALR
jgi:hypothetical protein